RLASIRHRLDVRFERVGRERVVGPESALALFRVLQEAITNVAKHCGKGTVVEVTLTFEGASAALRIQDRGPGFDPPDDGDALSREAVLKLLEKVEPDVLLQDLGLPRMSGIEVTRLVKKRWPEVEVLIFTIFDEEEKVLDAVKAGASGYLLKGSSSDRIVDAI